MVLFERKGRTVPFLSTPGSGRAVRAGNGATIADLIGVDYVEGKEL